MQSVEKVLGTAKVGQKKILIPAGVKCEFDGDVLVVHGAAGKNVLHFGGFVKIDNNHIVIEHGKKAFLNTYEALLKNAFEGSEKGFSKVVNLHGVGYKVEKSGDLLEFSLGYSHKISVAVPAGVACEIKSVTQVVFSSASKQLLGDFIANILKLRKPNPYKLKGVLKEGQFVRRKEGKRK